MNFLSGSTSSPKVLIVKRSADALHTSFGFQQISGGRNALGGRGHPGSEFSSPSDVVRGEDGA
jgi:hypothetical protein